MKESDSGDATFTRMDSAAKVITEFKSALWLQQLINDGDRNKFDQYLRAVKKIQRLIKSGMISGYESQGGLAMNTLQMVFQGILDCSISGTHSVALKSTVNSSSVSCSSGYELQASNYTGHGELSSEQVYRLRAIVKRMKSAECLRDCIGAYKNSRRAVVVARFLRFGINDLQSWDEEKFAAKITLWIQAANTFYNTIFPREKKYYDQIFAGVRPVTYSNPFLDIVELVAIELNHLVDVSPNASFQNLFAVLDLYKALLGLLPKIKNIFHTVSCTDISDGVSNTISSLETLVRKLFSGFKDAVLNESSNSLSPEGGVHHMTEYTMKFITKISLYREVLTKLIVSRPTESLGNEADAKILEASGGTPLQLHMIWIMISLRINLESKSTFYKDSSLGYLFIMNNFSYIIKILTDDPELLDVIGTEYQTELSKDVLQAAQDYVSSTWRRVLYCSRRDGLSYMFSFFRRILKDSGKKRFKAFNTALEKVCQTQSARIIPDTHLRAQLHEMILSKLLPAYESFLEKYGSHIQSERYKERYIKYSSEDLQNKIQNLFWNI
ncbi:hypothetical protein DCAR_0104775 [Daucus carota subsp. sativus]|uniref:Exocyst subunit Exo70 family protein n=1 Tax=Daucus carota subsp. sativus TaxID=79200 RepID=A0A166J3R5_DAUCS|nr:PREDICTED: exocyst complex component EXO70A1-like [Daucus carota subsp. sativus]WOG85584.1 hypothetical protein DCAR_0104775 [Daucus carota subsp. sativus]